MGAMINIKYDDNAVNNEQVIALVEAAKVAVIDVIKDGDVFVYADPSLITSGIEPIEIFVQLNSSKIDDAEKITGEIAANITNWKTKSQFEQTVNLNVIPVEWHSRFHI